MAVKTDKAKQILTAALDLFAMNGYEMTTIPNIAEKADVGTGTIYRYFDSKKSLLNVLYQDCMNTLYDTLSKDGNATSAYEQFDFMFSSAVKLFSQHPQISIFLNKTNFNKELDQKSKDTQDKVVNFIARFIEKGQHSGSLKRLNEQSILTLLYGSLTFVIDFVIHDQPRAKETDQVFHDLKIACWNAIKA